jgi:hypothetical protein
MPDHYRTLGVHPTASADQIRAAYRDLARRLHPDHHREASTPEASLAERRMREINEAWRVLQDPARRRRYDAERVGGAATARSGAGPGSGPGAGSTGRVRPDDDEDLVLTGPPDLAARAMHGLPWLVLIAVLGFIFVMTAYAGNGSDSPETGARAAPIGACLVVTAGPSTSVVPCDRPNTGKVVARVPDMGGCPDGTDPRRLAPDGQTDCLDPP